MLDRISFKNFKSLRSLTLELSPLTALVGPNGSGKSSVLHGIHLLSQTALEHRKLQATWARFDELFTGSFDPRRLASSTDTSTIELSMREEGADELLLQISIPVGGGRAKDIGYTLAVDGHDGRHEASLPPGTNTEGSPDESFDHPRIRRFASIVYLHLDANLMVLTSATDEAEPRLAPDGHGLASTLAWLAGAKPDTLRDIVEMLRRVVPGVRRVLAHRERVSRREMDKVIIDGQPVWRPVERTQLGDRFSIEFDDGTEVPADLLSEGTVLALGLLTKLHEPERPRVLLLDDIDRGLHIGAQAKLVAVLRDLMREDPQLQVVCTTHSAYLLDLFDPSEVRVLDLDGARSTHARPLSEHPDFEKWRFGTQTGELWAALGDAWVTSRFEGSEQQP